jgi:hypothetical protein
MLERKATGVFLLQALPFPNTQCNNFEAYWKSVGLDLEEGIALLGSHCVADATNKYVDLHTVIRNPRSWPNLPRRELCLQCLQY